MHSYWHIWKWFWIICIFFWLGSDLIKYFVFMVWVDVLSRWRLVNDLYFGGLQMSFVRLDGIQAKVEICRIWLKLGV